MLFDNIEYPEDKSLRNKLDAKNLIRRKRILKKTFKEQIAHKGREEQEKYYRSKGYEPAS